jgi:putative membrane protein
MASSDLQVSASTELAMRRTGMAFQRTRMSADRTLMAVIRTSLALISFGFTIYQLFTRLHVPALMQGGSAPRNFGLSLVLLGVAMLIGGIAYHIVFMLGVRAQRRRLKAAGLLHGESVFPLSLTLSVAVLLLIVGVLAAISMVLKAGPYG